MPEKSEQVMVRLTPDLAAQLKVRSDEEERTVSQTVRLAIKRYLSDTPSVHPA